MKTGSKVLVNMAVIASLDVQTDRDKLLTACCMLLLGNSPASEFYMPTFRNTLFHIHRQVGISSYLPAYEDGTVFRNVGIKNSDAGELPRRKHTTTFRSRPKFEIFDNMLLKNASNTLLIINFIKIILTYLLQGAESILRS